MENELRSSCLAGFYLLTLVIGTSSLPILASALPNNVNKVGIESSVLLISSQMSISGERDSNFAEEGFTDSFNLSSQVLQPLLEKEDIISMTLRTDLQKLREERRTKDYQPGVLTYPDQSGNMISHNIEVKTRGRMRLENCDNPPLRIDLPAEAPLEDGFMSSRTLRIVVGCRDDASYSQALLREYLAYHLYHIITPKSFRVQLIDLQMEDNVNAIQAMSTYAFIIEDMEVAANRIDGKTSDEEAISEATLNSYDHQVLSVFQYMIGNTDWHISKDHNVKFVTTGTKQGPIAIPYDFDFSGFVNAPYAVPSKSLPIASVQDRYFIGPCAAKGYKEAIQHVKNKKRELLGAVINCSYLDQTSKDYALKYIEKSFEILEDFRAMEKEIERGCQSE